MIPSTHLSLLNALKDAGQQGAAWERFHGRYRDTIYAWCVRWGLQPASAEDVTQQVFLKLFQALPEHGHDPAQPFRHWLKAVVHNALRDLRRAERRHPADRGVGGPGFQNDLDHLAAPESLDELSNAIETLTDPALAAAVERVRLRAGDTFEAFWRVVVDGRPAREVAAEFGMSVGSVFKAKYRVAVMIGEEYKG
jgi:RNA polymerase sigma-70 factor (ECF subfamily)